MISNGKETKKKLLEELKSRFPDVKFYCKTDHSSCRIRWTNGPNITLVEKICSKYEFGYFDGMNDSYNYHENETDYPQCKYVFADRDLTDEFTTNIKTKIESEWGPIFNLDV